MSVLLKTPRCSNCRSYPCAYIELREMKVTYRASASGMADNEGTVEASFPVGVVAKCSKCSNQWRLQRATSIRDIWGII